MTTQAIAPVAARRLAPAISEALADEMEADDRILVWGEDVSIGVMSVTRGLHDRFGSERVRDTPISEAGFLGGAIGAAIGGLRPVVEIMYGSFAYVAWDQLVNQAARVRYMSGGGASAPFTLLIAMGAAQSLGAQHCEAPYASLLQATGLRVVFPSTPNQAYWLTRAAISCDDPSVVIHHPGLDGSRGLVQGPEFGLGDADVSPRGSDVTVVACGLMARRARSVAKRLEDEVSVEVVDLCSLNPLPREQILESAARTKRVVIVDEARGNCSLASEISALVGEELHGQLLGPVRRVTSPDVPMPFSPVLEPAIIPTSERIEAQIRKAADA